MLLGFTLLLSVSSFAAETNKRNETTFSVGDIVVNQYYRSLKKYIVTEVIDSKEVFAVPASLDSDHENYGAYNEVFETKYLSKQVKVYNGVSAGMNAICKHLYGRMFGTVTSVYENGNVEIKHERSTNFSDGYIPSGSWMKTFWSSASKEKKPAYPCKYY